MPDEPNSKMDDLLKAYAKKRREQGEAPGEIHPATRRLLQDEVKRTFGVAAKSDEAGWRKWRWPLVAMWGGMVVLILAFAMINMQMDRLLPREEKNTASLQVDSKLPQVPQQEPFVKHKSEMATRDIAARGESNTATTPVRSTPATFAAAPSPAPETIAPAPQPGGFAGGMGPTGVAGPSAVAAAPPTSASAAGIPEGAGPGAVSRQSLSSTRSASDSVASDMAVNSAVRAAAPRFRGAAPADASAAASPPPTVLRNFTVTREGSKVTVQDADGSVYAGTVQHLAAMSQEFGRRESPAASAPKSPLTFKVTGRNNTLQQEVEFSGMINPTPAGDFTNNAFSALTAPAATGGAAKAKTSATSTISGRVKMGDSSTFSVEATSLHK